MILTELKREKTNSPAPHVLLSPGQLCPPHAGKLVYSSEASSAHTGSQIDCQELQLDVIEEKNVNYLKCHYDGLNTCLLYYTPS